MNLPADSTPTSAPRATALAVLMAQCWLALGLLALAVLPEARGHSEWFGWMPFWLVATPALQWLFLRRRAVFNRFPGAGGRGRGQHRVATASRARRARRVPRAQPVLRASRLLAALVVR